MYRAPIGIVGRAVVGVAAIVNVLTAGTLFFLGRFPTAESIVAALPEQLKAAVPSEMLEYANLPPKIIDFSCLGLPCFVSLLILIFVLVRWYWFSWVVLVFTFLEMIVLQLKLAIFLVYFSALKSFVYKFKNYSEKFLENVQPLLQANPQFAGMFTDIQTKQTETVKTAIDLVNSQQKVAESTYPSVGGAICGAAIASLVFFFVTAEYTEKREREKEAAEFADIKSDLTGTERSEVNSPKSHKTAKTPDTSTTPNTANTPNTPNNPSRE